MEVPFTTMPNRLFVPDLVRETGSEVCARPTTMSVP
jgi:hypothetical protein